MKVFYCERLDDSLEFGCVIVAESLSDAKEQLAKTLKKEEWELEEEDMHLIEMKTNKAKAVLINPLQSR